MPISGKSTAVESNFNPSVASPRWEGILKSLHVRKEQILQEIDLNGDLLNTATMEMLLQLNERKRRELFQVSAAIDRISRDEYGECESCDDEIPISVLSQFPYIRLCQNCQER